MNKNQNPRHLAYQLLAAWQAQFSIGAALAAAVLGVSRRTVDRWHQKQRAPSWIAQFLDQLQCGPLVRMNVARGASCCFRDISVRQQLEGFVPAPRTPWRWIRSPSALGAAARLAQDIAWNAYVPGAPKRAWCQERRA